jgi:hypothetical protein
MAANIPLSANAASTRDTELDRVSCPPFWRAWLNGWYFGSSGHDSERAAMIYQHEARGTVRR